MYACTLYYISKKYWTFLCSAYTMEIGEDFLDIQYVHALYNVQFRPCKTNAFDDYMSYIYYVEWNCLLNTCDFMGVIVFFYVYRLSNKYLYIYILQISMV